MGCLQCGNTAKPGRTEWGGDKQQRRANGSFSADAQRGGKEDHRRDERDQEGRDKDAGCKDAQYGKDTAAQGRPSTMNTQGRTGEPWEQILGLRVIRGEGDDTLTQTVNHLWEGRRGHEPHGRRESYNEWRTFADSEGAVITWRNGMGSPDDRARRGTCRPGRWKKTWGHAAAELWNDPGAHHALDVVQEHHHHSAVGPSHIRTGACRLYNTTAGRNKGRCTCPQQARRWMHECRVRREGENPHPQTVRHEHRAGQPGPAHLEHQGRWSDHQGTTYNNTEEGLNQDEGVTTREQTGDAAHATQGERRQNHQQGPGEPRGRGMTYRQRQGQRNSQPRWRRVEQNRRQQQQQPQQEAPAEQSNPPNTTTTGEHQQCQYPHRGGAPLQRPIGHVLSIAASALIRFERSAKKGPEDEARECLEWDRWAAEWHANWTTRVWGPPTSRKKQMEAPACEKKLYKAALQVLNALRARNQFRWLTAKAAQGAIHREDGVAGRHWQQVVWVAQVLSARQVEGDNEQSWYIPGQARGVLEDVRLVHPTTGERVDDRGTNPRNLTSGAWIYALRSMRSRRTYVGATDRKANYQKPESSPGERHREHLSRGWWQARGYRTGKKNSLPLYRMTKRWQTGLSELVMIPLVGVQEGAKKNAGSGGRKKSRSSGGVTCRTKLLALEAALQRVWRPAYTATWGRPRQTGRVRYIMGEAHRVQQRNEKAQELYLVYRSSGRKWVPSEDWKAQYRGDELALNTDNPWNMATCHEMIRRLCGHGKQAVATYRILRRGGKENLTRLWGAAGEQNRSVEQKVWTHIARALHGREKPVRRNRPVLKTMESSRAAAVPLVRWAWKEIVKMGVADGSMIQAVRLQKPPTVRVSEVARTDIAWQGRLSETTECACSRMRRWAKDEWGIAMPLPEHDGHVWMTLDWIMQNCNWEHESASMQWLRRCMDGENREPIFATQYLARTDKEVIREAAEVMARVAAIQTTCRRTSRDIVAVVRGALEKAMKTEVQEGRGWGDATRWAHANGSQEQEMTRDNIKRYLRMPWAVVTPMDKARHRLRYACPATAWQEMQDAAGKYCTRLGRMSTPEACAYQLRWREETEMLHRKWQHTGMPRPPDHATPATARTVPKGKAPMLKSRMLVGTHVTAGRTQAGITCRAAEFLVALGYADGAGRSQIVESMSQVRQQIAEMNKDLRAAYGAGHVFLSCRKYDFVAFFQEVPRQEVKRSLQFWSYVNKRRYKGRNTVRIDSQARALYGRAHPREDRWKQGSGYVPRCPDCTLVRGGGNPGTGIYYIPTRAIPDYLDADARILIATGTDLSQQQTGLTIGSSWGGTGAKLWASHRELLQEWQRTRQRRHMTCPHCGAQCDHTYEATAHGGGSCSR